MKIVHACCFIVAAMFLPPAFGQGAASSPSGPWYHLNSDQTYNLDFSLQPGETKSFQIATQKSLMVGFQTDLTNDQVRQITKAPDWAHHALELSSADGMRMRSTGGGAGTFTPQGGAIMLKLKNNTGLPVRAVIFTQPDTMTMSAQDTSAAPAQNLGAAPAQAAPSTSSGQWYNLRAGETYFADYSLQPGETRSFQIPAQKPITVGFKTELSEEQQAELGKQKDWAKHMVEISTANEGFISENQSFGSFSGVRTTFTPHGSGLPMKIQNNMSAPVRVVIFTTTEISNSVNME